MISRTLELIYNGGICQLTVHAACFEHFNLRLIGSTLILVCLFISIYVAALIVFKLVVI